MSESSRTIGRLLSIVGPGVLVAATGVGAGDLATAAFAGSALGTSILWVVLLGATLKFLLNENLARWQIATGETILEGALTRFGRPLQILFLLYLLPWSFFTGAALMSACGVTLQTIFNAFDNPDTGRVVFGIISSLVGLVLVRLGGFKLFERLMTVCIGLMVVAVVITALRSDPDWLEVGRGLVWPTIPDLDGEGLRWSVALMGGVGGTLTIICYAYWMRECGRTTRADLPRCRLDLIIAYTMTALFSVAMVIIARDLTVSAGGAKLISNLSGLIGETSGAWVGHLFIAGAFGAIFSSLLGVWQAVPLVFAEFARTSTKRPWPHATGAYRVALATVPIGGLFVSFKQAQLFYTISGALFIPALAGVLLLLNRRTEVGDLRNGPAMSAALIATFLLLGFGATLAITRALG